MSDSPPDEQLEIVARLRAHIAWLGETPRFGWWQTDALSPEGGGEMLKGIFPRTHGWAAVQIAWACAATVEGGLVPPGSVSLFRLGADIEARLTSWLPARKRA